MNCLAASDIHGSGKALESVLAWLAKLNADMLILAGDMCLQDEESIQKLRACRADVAAVMGNCDTPELFHVLGMHPVTSKRLHCMGRTMLITHGHKAIDTSLFGLAKGDVCISGHTHVPHLYRDAEGIIMLNPGSAGRPRNGIASFAQITTQGINILSLDSGRSITSLEFSRKARKAKTN